MPMAESDTTLKLRVLAPPEKGEANAAVVALLAKALGIPKKQVSIARGETSREKQVAVTVPWSPEEWPHRLGAACLAPPEWFEVLN